MTIRPNKWGKIEKAFFNLTKLNKIAESFVRVVNLKWFSIANNTPCTTIHCSIVSICVFRDMNRTMNLPIFDAQPINLYINGVWYAASQQEIYVHANRFVMRSSIFHTMQNKKKKKQNIKMNLTNRNRSRIQSSKREITRIKRQTWVQLWVGYSPICVHVNLFNLLTTTELISSRSTRSFS